MAATLKLGDGEWGIKEDSLLAYNDESGNYKPLPFDFSRASTATRVNSDGLIESVASGVPRIDFSDNADGALKLEPQRTNLVTYSEDFSQWNKSSVAITITTNYGLSPDGLNNSSRVQFTGASQHINISTSLGTGVTSTGSVYIKGTLGETIEFDTGGVGELRTLTGNWQRIEVTSTSVSSLLLINTFGGATARDIQVFGAQCEQGSYATSYIKTEGSAVTRLADSCDNGANEQVINSTEGILYLELKALANDGTNRYISINDGTTSNRVNIFYDTNNVLRGFITGISSMPTSATITNNNKIALKYKSGDIALWINGVEVATKTDSISLSGLKSVSFDQTGGLNWYGTCKDMKIYNTALTDAELASLTQV